MRRGTSKVATASLAAVSQLEWTSFIRGGQPGGFLPEVLLRSWERSREAGVDPEPRQLECRRVDETNLQSRLVANQELLDVSAPHVERLSTILGREPHSCSIRDRDGIILYATGTDEETRHRLGILPGYDWSEVCKGTTAAAVCEAEDQPYAVIGAEHYIEELHAMATYAAPIHSSEKIQLSVLSLSVPVAAQQLALLVLVSHTAHVIEHELARGVVRNRFDHPRRRIISVSEGTNKRNGRESSSTGGERLTSLVRCT